jgi:RND superfamily putative drug exporter
LPPEAFETADFQRGIKLFLSPDGHAVRFTVFHQGDPLSEQGTAHIEPLRVAAVDAIKGTPLEGSTVYVGGSAAPKDMQQGADYDLLIAAVASLILIFLIMVVLTGQSSPPRSSSAPWC